MSIPSRFDDIYSLSSWTAHSTS